MTAKAQVNELLSGISEADAKRILPFLKESLKRRSWADVPVGKPTIEDIADSKEFHASQEYKDILAGKYDAKPKTKAKVKVKA